MTIARSRGLVIVAALTAAGGAYWVARMAADDMAARSVAIFVLAAVFWAAEFLPLFATALLVVALEVLFLATDGGLADEVTRLLALAGLAESQPGIEPIPASAFVGPFASDIIMLFLGGFLLAAAVTRHGVDHALAGRLLRRISGSPLALIYSLAGLSAFFSMWMSNTATAAMMIALSRPILGQVPPGSRFRQAVVMAIAFGANVGGIGTPIGTPPNAIAFGALNRAGYEITFLRWMLIAVPLEALLLVGVGVLLYSRYRPEPGLRLVVAQPSTVGLSRAGSITLMVLAAAIVLWMTGGRHGLSPGTVALLAAAALLMTGVIGRQDVDAIDWKVLILMWGALSLGVAVQRSGLGGHLARIDLSLLPGGTWAIGAVIALAGVSVSTFMSNTAAAALLVPMALAVSAPGREEFAMLAALACSFAMAMPVSTPPNSLAYATGEVPRSVMIRAGGLISALGLILMLVGFHFILPFAF